MRALSCWLFVLGCVAATSLSASAVASAPAPASWPFAYNWSKFPAAWFGANATTWESPAQIEAIGKYSLAILGW